MSSIKSAFHSIAERLKDNTIFNINPVIQDKRKEIRYSRRIDFNEKVIMNFFNKEINLNSKKFNISLLK